MAADCFVGAVEVETVHGEARRGRTALPISCGKLTRGRRVLTNVA